MVRRFVMLLAASVVLGSCIGAGSGGGVGGDGTGGRRVTGVFGNGASGAASGKVSVRSLADAITSIGSIDLISTDLSENVEEMETHAVEDDGSFDFDVDGETNNVFLVLNENGATNFERFVAFLVVEENGSVLEEIPVGASVSTIDFGGISIDGENAESEFPFSRFDDYFDLGQNGLVQIASLDDYLRSLKNIYVNTFDDGGSIDLNAFSYGFYADYFAVENQWSPIGTIEYQGAGAPHFEFHLDGEVSFDSLLDESNVIELYPPTDVVTVDQTMSPTRPFTTVDDGLIDDFSREVMVTDGERHTFRGYFFVREPVSADLSLSPHLYFDDWPEGDWRFEINGEPRAHFDLAVTNPILPDGRPKGLVPSLRIDTAADGRVVRAAVRWFYYDAQSDGYAEILDTSDLGELVEHVGFNFVGADLATYDNVSEAAAEILSDLGHFEESAAGFDQNQLDFVVTPEDLQETWYFGIETDEFLVPTTIKVQFRIYGITFGYIFYKNAGL